MEQKTVLDKARLGTFLQAWLGEMVNISGGSRQNLGRTLSGHWKYHEVAYVMITLQS